MSRLSPNISLLFTEHQFSDRFKAAQDHGFEAIEFWPWEDQSVIRKQVAVTGLSVSVLNVNPGPPGSHGELANPDATQWWQDELVMATKFALDIGCTTINALTGNRLQKYSLDDQLSTAAANLAEGLARMDGSGIDLVLEPLGPDRPGYLTRTVADAAKLRKAAGDPPTLMLLFDFYHLYQTESQDVAELFVETVDFIKHVQIADVPGRHQPGSGCIDWAACRRAVDIAGYPGWIGLEYAPTENTADSLAQALTQWTPGRGTSDEHGR